MMLNLPKNKSICPWLASLLLSLAPCLPSHGADTVTLYLKNGDRITGSISSASPSHIILASPLFGQISIPTDQIQKREPASPTPPILTPAKTLTNKPTPPKPDASVPASPAPAATPGLPSGTPAKSPTAAGAPSPNPLWSSLRKFIQHWQGELQLGANLGFSTKNRQTFSGRFKAVHTHEPMRNVLDYNVSYGTTQGVLSDNQMDGSWKIEYDLGQKKRFLLYNAAGAGYNEIQAIDLRYDVGPGVGYKVFLRTNFVLKTELGGNYQEQFFANGTEKKRYAARLAEDAWWQATKKLRLDQKIEFFPEIQNFGQYRFRLEGNLSHLLRDNLTFTLSIIDLYDTSVPANVSRNDLQIRSLVGIKF